MTTKETTEEREIEIKRAKNRRRSKIHYKQIQEEQALIEIGRKRQTTNFGFSKAIATTNWTRVVQSNISH